jgi:hypothetical protein
MGILPNIKEIIKIDIQNVIYAYSSTTKLYSNLMTSLGVKAEDVL